MNTLELLNPSKFFPLLVYSSDRSRNTFEKAPAPAALAPKRDTHAELEKRGNEKVIKPTRISTKFGSEIRNVENRVFQALGYETLNQYVTEISEKQLRESQAALTVAPAVQRLVDEWSEAKPFASIAPHSKASLPLDEAKRYLVECEEEVCLQVQNQSTVRTIRLRNHDAETGASAHVAFVAPLQVAVVFASKKSASVVELLAL